MNLEQAAILDFIASTFPAASVRERSRRLFAAICFVLAIAIVAGLTGLSHGGTIQISEIRTDNPGTDTDEYIEISGPPGTPLDGYALVGIGDGAGGCGTVEFAQLLDGQVIPADGFFVVLFTLAVPNPQLPDAPYMDMVTLGQLENSDNVTFLLVSGWFGVQDMDLDFDDDGVLDDQPWFAIVDEVGIDEGLPADCVSSEYLYTSVSVGPDGAIAPAHIYRCDGAWEIGPFGGVSWPLETEDTPGMPNSFCESTVFYTLSVTTIGNGSVIANPDQPSYGEGTIVELTAVPDPGWEFVAWSGDASGSANPTSVLMDGNKSVTATFEAAAFYTLDITVLGSGSVTRDPDQATYQNGTSVQITAVPSPGWRFGGWDGDASGLANPTTLVVDDNKSVAAVFGIEREGGFSTEMVDVSASRSDFTSIVLDVDDAPHIGYWNDPAGDLMYARKAAGVWSLETAMAGQGVSGGHTSMELDATENPHIAYFAVPGGNGDLRYAWKSGGMWTMQTVDATNVIDGQYASLALDANGDAHVSYHADANGTRALKYAKRSSGVWTREVVDDNANILGRHGSIELDPMGNPHIGYRDQTLTDVKYAVKTAGAWTIEFVESSPNDLGVNGISIALDAQGNPHMAYYDQTGSPRVGLKYAYKTSGQWTIEVAVPGMPSPGVTGPGANPSLRLDDNGNPHVAYRDLSAAYDDLWYAKKENGTWVVARVDSVGSLASGAISLALGSDGRPHVSYTKGENDMVDMWYSVRQNPTSVPTYGEQSFSHPLVCNTPNPFRPSTTIEFELPRAGLTRMSVYDASGRLVRVLADENMQAGLHARHWDGRDSNGATMPSGVYFARLETASLVNVRKMTLLR